jgi:hypothetical protein
MANNEQAVRDAAAALKKAITEAKAAGYRIHWPSNADGLDTIAISETSAVKQPERESGVALTRPAKSFGADTAS